GDRGMTGFAGACSGSARSARSCPGWWVEGFAVLLGDAVEGQEGLEGVAGAFGQAAASAGVAGGVDHSVVGQGGGGVAVRCGGVGEGVSDDASGDAQVGGQVGEEPRVVVEPANVSTSVPSSSS